MQAVFLSISKVVYNKMVVHIIVISVCDKKFDYKSNLNRHIYCFFKILSQLSKGTFHTIAKYCIDIRF